MMLRLRLLIAAGVLVGCSILGASASAQTATLRGFVKDGSDGQPLVGVNVVLTNDGDALYGAATNSDGFYAISRVPAGRYYLRATFVGFQTVRDTLDLAAGDLRTYEITLQPDKQLLDEVVVEAESETAGAASVTAGLQTIRPGDVELIPAPDVSGDLVSYIVTLPGVVAQGDRGGQLFIRGGEATQNLVLLDGMLVYQPFHIVGFYSAFPSDIINTTDVYAGGYGGKYGGRISSVIDVQTRTGNKRQFAGSVSAAPFVSSVTLEGPLVKDRLSFLFSGRLSTIDQGASKIIDRELPFDFDDQFGKLHLNISESSQASISALRTYDKGIIGAQEIGDFRSLDQVTWTNQAVGGRYILLPSTLPVFAEVLMSVSQIESTFGDVASPNKRTLAQEVSVGANVTHYAGNTDVNWGLFLRSTKLDSKLGGQFQNFDTEREFVTEAGVYVEPEFSFANGLRLRPGLRVQTFPSKSQTFIEPRFRAIWQLGKHRLSGAWGIYHQEIVGLQDRRDAGNIFTVWAASPLGLVPEAMHFIAGYQLRPADWLTLSLEGFYKQLRHLSIPEWTAFPRFTSNLQEADGDARGFDARIEVSKGPFYGFVTYGFSKVAYEALSPSVRVWYGDAERRFSPPHDRRHQINAVGSLEIAGFDVSVRWQFGSGLPFTEALGFDRFVLLNGPTDVRQQGGSSRVIYGPPFQSRLPTYHRLDISVEREIHLGGRANGTIQLGLINGYDRTNLFYFDIFTLRRVDQLPLIPSAGIKLSID